MDLPLSKIPTDRVVWINCFHPNDLDHAVAATASDAPVVISHRTDRSQSQSGTVTTILDEMEAVAGRLLPAWLPEAEGITTSVGAAPAAVQALAIRHAATTAQYGPFLADLAVGALTGDVTYTQRHHPEVRARGLSRVLTTSFGRSVCALLLRPPEDLDEYGACVLVRAAQWLIDHGGFAVWINGGSPPALDELLEITVAQPIRDADVVPSGPRREVRSTTGRRVLANGRPPRQTPASERRRRSVVGKPHPASRAEVALEAALANRPWAAGRAWNHTVRLGPLVNPVRVDLLWKRERCIVEIDGNDHRTAEKYAEDRNRDVMLQLSGYAVLRFTNTKVLDDIESVLALLQQFLATRRRAGKGN